MVIQDLQVLALPRECLASCGMLQELSHSSQGVALGSGQGAACCHGHNVKGIGGHYSWVQESVVQEVPYHLRAEETTSEALRGGLDNDSHSPSPSPSSLGQKGPSGPALPRYRRENKTGSRPATCSRAHSKLEQEVGLEPRSPKSRLSTLSVYAPAAFPSAT